MFNHSVKERMSNLNRSEMWSISSQIAREGRIIYCPSGEGDRAAGLGLFRRSHRASEAWAAYMRSEENRTGIQRWREAVRELQEQREHQG